MVFCNRNDRLLYTIVQPPLLRRGHPPLRVAARAYAIAAGLMVLTLLLVVPVLVFAVVSQFVTV